MSWRTAGCGTDGDDPVYRIIRGRGRLGMRDVGSRTGGQWLRAVVVVCVACAGCGPTAPIEETAAQASTVDVSVYRPEATDAVPWIVAMGDSLTAGLGLSPEDAYPAKLQERLDAAGYRLRVVDAGVSGDTTAGGLRRLEWVLEGDVRILIVALGGNDGLRGLPVEQMKDNLSQIVTTAVDRGIQVLLAGMEAPPNFGAAYTDRFRRVFRELGAEHEVVVVPFLLAGVAGLPELNQPDGIHPNAEGAGRVATQLWSALEPMLLAAVGDVN